MRFLPATKPSGSDVFRVVVDVALKILFGCSKINLRSDHEKLVSMM